MVMLHRHSTILGLICVLFLSLPTILPLFHEGFFPMHDDTQVVRVQQMGKALADGQFPVRWVSDLGYGYGYPLFNYYAPLPYYVGGVLNLLGFSPLVATKFMFEIGIITAGLFMFLLVNRISGALNGVISAMVYQYAPYHALDIYVRGAVGEFWAISLLPLVVLGIIQVSPFMLQRTASTKNIPYHGLLVGGIGYAALILSHNITALLFTLFMSIFILTAAIFQLFRRTFSFSHFKHIYFYVAIILIGLLVSAFFWLPAIAEKDLTNVDSIIGGGTDYKDHFLYIDQLWDWSWGFAGSSPGRADGMSFKVGKLNLVLAFISLSLLVWQYLKKSANNKLIILTICIVSALLISIFMTLNQSLFIWNYFPFLAFVQYPWRFLVFIIFSISIIAGIIGINNRIKISYVLIVCSLIIILHSKYFNPQTYIIFPGNLYESDEYIKWWVSKISDEYMPQKFPVPKSKEQIVKEKIQTGPNVTVTEKNSKAHRYTMKYNAEKESSLVINTAYFPIWKIMIDGQQVSFKHEINKINLLLPAGMHKVEIKLTNTWVRSVANSISLFSILGLFGTIMRLKLNSYAKKFG